MPAPTPLLTSPKPYLIRAWHEWMSDNGLTPHILVKVDASVSVPREYVKNGEVVLNVGTEATGALALGNETVSFQARFAGRVREIVVPINRIVSIFARENGQGMVFELLAEEEEIDQNTNSIARSVVTESPDSSATSSVNLTLVDKLERIEDSSPSNSRKDTPDDQPPTNPSVSNKGGNLKVVK